MSLSTIPKREIARPDRAREASRDARCSTGGVVIDPTRGGGTARVGVSSRSWV